MVTMEEVAHYAFLAFVIIAIIAGLALGYMAYDAKPLHWNDPSVADATAYVTLIMLILGIIVGLISIASKDVTTFLIAAIALAIARVGVDVWSPLAKIHELLYYWADGILRFLVAFVTPAAVILAAMAVYKLEKKK